MWLRILWSQWRRVVWIDCIVVCVILVGLSLACVCGRKRSRTDPEERRRGLGAEEKLMKINIEKARIGIWALTRHHKIGINSSWHNGQLPEKQWWADRQQKQSHGSYCKTATILKI